MSLLMKGSKSVHFTDEVVHISEFTDERVEVIILY